jgi:predicted dehydrogenase
MGFFSFFRGRNNASAAPDSVPAPRFGYAVVGLGHIAGYFLDGLKDSPTCTVAAVISGDAAKAAKIARKYSVPRSGVYADFETVCALPGVDAVYLALPVSLHREYTERAAAAGKHVLCEKPMAPNVEDARAMIAACASAGVQLSVAYRCPHLPLHQRLREIVDSGALGPKESLQIVSGFGFTLDPGWRDSPALAGGGSLYDVGIYPLNAARFLLREEPVAVEDATATCDEAGLEREIQWTSVFPSGARAVCQSSYMRNIQNSLRVTGATGWALLEPAFSHRDPLRLRGEWQRAKIDERTPRGTPSDFRLEAELLAAAAHGEAELLTPGEDGLADMVAMQAIYAAAGVTRNAG